MLLFSLSVAKVSTVRVDCDEDSIVSIVNHLQLLAVVCV